jgi:esterase/lipase superfamily enzyme
VVTATDDLALAVSQIVNGGTVRVGKAEAARLKRLGLLVIDGSQKGWSIINHNRFMSNADIRREIHEAMDRCRGSWGCGQLMPAQK